MHPQYGTIPVPCFYLDWAVMLSVDKWMISWWLSRFAASITSVMKKVCTMWHSFLTPSQLPFPVQSRKPHVLHSHQKIESHLPFLGLWFLAEHPLIIFLKEIQRDHCSPQTLSVFSLLLDKPSVSHPISSSFLISSVNLRQHCPIPPSLTLSSPPCLQIRVCRCVFAVRETSARTVNHLYCSIAISLALWCSLGMSNGTKKTHKPHNYRPEKWGESETACLSS